MLLAFHSSSADYGKALLKVTVFAQCIIQRACPAVNNPARRRLYLRPNTQHARLGASRFSISQTNHFLPAASVWATSLSPPRLSSAGTNFVDTFLSLLVPAPVCVRSIRYWHGSPILVCGAWGMDRNSAQSGGSSGHGGRVYELNGAAGSRMGRLVVDDAVDSIVGYGSCQ